MAERRQSSRNGNSRCRTRSSSTPPTKRSLGFSTPSTSSASARDRNVPVRFGKWSVEEDAYLSKLIWLFEHGLLADMEPKRSLRSFLALMLNCCPMRISKKQMNGHSFVGKTKYVRHSNKMTQQEYDKLCHEVWRLRDEFLMAWAKDEYARRNSRVNQDEMSFQDWYDKVVSLVPTPKLAKRSNLKECKKKRPIESLDELNTQVQDSKRQKVEKLTNIRPVQAIATNIRPVQVVAVQPERENPQDTPRVEMLESVEILPLEPAPIPDNTAVMALPTSYCSENVSVGDWLATSDRGRAVAHWTDFQSLNHGGESRYTLCEDAVQVSLHLNDQQPSLAELSMTRRSSKLIIDFGAPSCWHTDEESKHEPFFDYSQWTENDLTEELAMATDSSTFSWDDSSSPPYLTYSPTLNFL
ncbi:hypothetical protein L916_01234 [Phytophthora nicotianae]|uniref:Uncharacterized protein n=1 Tax=Phytophthora nicotianae TaxID=4792 RepID=W2JUD4_PHYNI|nr:hypothetical protein L916_01234 [Phytophthora nicotianae]